MTVENSVLNDVLKTLCSLEQKLDGVLETIVTINEKVDAAIVSIDLINQLYRNLGTELISLKNVCIERGYRCPAMRSTPPPEDVGVDNGGGQ